MASARPSLRTRLFVLLVAATGTVWIAVAVATYLDARHHADKLLDAQLTEYSELLAAIAGHEIIEMAGQTTRLEHEYAQALTYQVFSTSGDLMLRSHLAPTSPLAQQDGFSDAQTAGSRWRVFRRVDFSQGLVFVVAQRMALREELALHVALQLALPALVGVPLLAFAIWLAVTRSLAPLERLAREVGRRDPDRLAPVPTAGAPREVEPLVEALNELFGRLERTFESERRFTGDAAHELRTPLAAIKTQAEVAMTTASEERRLRALEQVVAGTDRLARLVEQMLALARLDAIPVVPRERVDLAGVARELVAQAGARPEAGSLDIAFDGTGEACVTGAAELLAALLRNLLDNAIIHTPAGGAIHVSVARDAGRVRLRVEDSGPGVPEELRGRIFDRFFRAAPGAGEGSGLGLSIARRIAELHGGSIGAQAGVSLPGLVVTLDLPAA